MADRDSRDLAGEGRRKLEEWKRIYTNVLMAESGATQLDAKRILSLVAAVEVALLCITDSKHLNCERELLSKLADR